MTKKLYDDFIKFAKDRKGVNSIFLDKYFQNMTRYIIEEKPTRFREVDVFSCLIRDRIIFLGTEIDAPTANTIIAQLLYLASMGDDRISLYINSPGGSVYDGLAIYDTMQFIKPVVETVSMGLSASMAAVILASGEKTMRYALPHSRIMIHQPLGEARGQATEIEIRYKQIESIKKEIYEILEKHTGQNIEKIRIDSERDHWLTAQEAKDYGIIDDVYEI